ncbi:hypothetical protein OUZ56_013017 [Daphnia magna]|uniref:Uncharacterized protein n=1 Tax=Daphnia magna TaxID=35525 RepID=A0ABQ9Z4P2_9CRUS|nr:hypothetical protein OUZ56_013017 [Daphnia magna]
MEFLVMCAALQKGYANDGREDKRHFTKKDIRVHHRDFRFYTIKCILFLPKMVSRLGLDDDVVHRETTLAETMDAKRNSLRLFWPAVGKNLITSN